MPAEKVTLKNELTYRSGEFSFSSAASLRDNAEICFAYSYELDTETLSISLKLLWSGDKEPFSKRELYLISMGFPPIPRDDEKLYIPEGNYSLVSLPSITNEDDIKAILLPFVMEEQKGICYVRFMKANGIVTATLFAPCCLPSEQM